jgi:hypothetical protein
VGKFASVVTDANRESRLVVVAVFCLCIGHPGFAFKDRKGNADYSNLPGIAESINLMESQKTAYSNSR